MNNVATKSLRAAAIKSLCFDHEVQAAFVRALRDEELNAQPRVGVMTALISETVGVLFNLEGWWVEEEEVEAAMKALSAFGDALDPRRLAA